MLEALNRNHEIRSFLGLYPTQQWKQCLEALVVIGIHSLKTRNGEPPTLEELQQCSSGNRSKATSRRSQPESPIKEDSGYMLRSSSAPHQRPEPHSKPPPVQRSIPRAPVQRWNEGTPRFKQEVRHPHLQEKSTFKAKNTAGKREKPLPKYLQSVKSKIKGDVKKDIAYFRYQVDRQSLPAGGVGSIRNSDSLSQLIPDPPEDSPAGSQLHLESLADHQNLPPVSRASDIVPRPIVERTFLTEPNTSLKHADELYSQVSETSFHRPIKEETDTQVHRLSQERGKSPTYVEDRSRDSAYSEEETGDLIHIAENFLRDPLMAHLSRKDVGASQDSFAPGTQGVDRPNSRMSFKQRWDDTLHGQDWESDQDPSLMRLSNHSPDGLYYTSVGSSRITPTSSMSYYPDRLRTDSGSYRFL